MIQKEGNKVDAYYTAKNAFFGQLWGSSWPQLMEILLSTLRFLNMSLEKSFKYTFVSMGNWLISVSLGLLCLQRPHLTTMCPQKDTNRAKWYGMTQFWGQSWSNGVVLVEKLEDLTKKAPFLKQLWTSNSLFSLIMLPQTPYYWLSQSCGSIGIFKGCGGIK